MIGIMIDKELLYKMDLCSRCNRRWRTGVQRPRNVKPTCVELSSTADDGGARAEKLIAMGYVFTHPNLDADDGAAHHYRSNDRPFWSDILDLIEEVGDHIPINAEIEASITILMEEIRALPSVRAHLTGGAAWHTDEVYRRMAHWEHDPEFDEDFEGNHLQYCVDQLRGMMVSPWYYMMPARPIVEALTAEGVDRLTVPVAAQLADLPAVAPGANSQFEGRTRADTPVFAPSVRVAPLESLSAEEELERIRVLNAFNDPNAGPVEDLGWAD
jgi:hypothetical protein